MGAATVPISRTRTRRRGALWNFLAVLVSVGVCLGFVLREMVGWGIAYHGLPLTEALWVEHNQWLTISTIVVGVLLLAVLMALLVGTPRSLAAREARVRRDGLELVAHPKGWYRGHRAVLYWENIQVISARYIIVHERSTGSLRHVPREVLDLYLFRDVKHLPDFAVATTIDNTPPEGVRTPAMRVRIGGRPGGAFAATVRELATAVDTARPDLFYRGTAVDQWSTLASSDPAQSGHASLSGGAAAVEDSAPVVPEAPAEEVVAAPFAVCTPLWLDFRVPPRRTFATLVALVAMAAVSYAPIVLLAGVGDGVLVGLAGLVFTVPFLAGLIGAVGLVIGLPRALASVGILVDAEGVELVEKRRWGLRGLVRARVAWDEVQVVIARESAVIDAHGLQRPQNRPVTDIYLRGDGTTSFQRPGVGLSVEVKRLEQPDSTDIRTLATFPAVRLRLPYSARDEQTTAAGWDERPPPTPGPRRLPGAQLRAALYAARPDLCHGFHRESVGP